MESGNFHGAFVSKKSLEWNLNDYVWDGDRFTAEPLSGRALSDCRSSKQLFPTTSEIPIAGISNVYSFEPLSAQVLSDCRSSKQLFPTTSEIPVISDVYSRGGSDELTLGKGKGKKELEKRRRTIVIEDDDEENGEGGSLNLKLGEQLYPVVEEEMEKWEGKSGKKTKIVGVSTNRAVCQVQDCQADLSSAKDYHRRHKVCYVHSKAAQALVGNVMQRFCQQCSRFHVLEEFDEGKRSCRRRLAGHNKRRRKTHPENVANGASMNDEGGINCLLVSLLRILANVQFNSSDQTKDQDLLSHLLRNLASLAGAANERNASGSLPAPSEPKHTGTSMEAPKEDSLRPNGNCSNIPASEVTEKRMSTSDAERGISQNPCASQRDSLCCRKESLPINVNASASTSAPSKLNIDLNNIYDDSQGDIQKLQNSGAFANPGAASSGCPPWINHDPHKSSSTRTSWNSGSTSSLSPSSSSGEAQSRTDRIVFKLFGKDPGEIPTALRKQVLDWLSHSPTDIESYIRPGCIILTIYLRMDKSSWEGLYCDLNSSLRKLLNASTGSFWRTGWVYTRVNNRVAFLFNGQVVLDTPLPGRTHRSCGISIVKPIAVCASERVQFLVKGFNLSHPTTRLLCALEGKYLVQGNCTDMVVGADSSMDHEEIQSVSFPCIVPNVTGRGFIEVEDHGLSSNFFPFIVAEKDVCAEIRTLESIIEVAKMDDGFLRGTEEFQARDQALDFLHELGWLLRRSHFKFRVGSGADLNPFTFQRFKRLIDFSIDHDWCAVVKKLLDVFFNGVIDVGQQSCLDIPLREVGILHRAVRRKCRSMVDVLLKYHHQDDRGYLFRPDAVGPGGLTPLHVVASLAGCENLLDALTADPGQVGIEAWRSARDSTGLTPNDYACLRGHYSYVHMVQKKINQKPGDGHVVLDIPGSLLDINLRQKLSDGHSSVKVASFQTEKSLNKPIYRQCGQCKQKLSYGNKRTSLIYKPAMLTVVTVAAICVCVALLFQSSPEVHYSYRPFSWELLKYGSI